MKLYVALAALLTAAPSPFAGDFKHDEAAIVRVACQRPQGMITGTAFKVSEAGYITARHVIEGGNCVVAGQGVIVTSSDEPNDYATFIGPASAATIPVHCGGFTAGQLYVARGYAGGGYANAYMPWLATPGFVPGFGQFRVFIGEVFGGMSGGPVIDGQGRAVGVVSKKNPTMATTLNLTGYCKA